MFIPSANRHKKNTSAIDPGATETVRAKLPEEKDDSSRRAPFGMRGGGRRPFGGRVLVVRLNNTTEPAAAGQPPDVVGFSAYRPRPG